MDEFETRSRQLFGDSTELVDMPVRSRLTQARYAALAAAAVAGRRPWFLRAPLWTPVAGVAAAALLGVALWVGLPGTQGPGVQSNLEVLDMVASSDGGPSDSLEMLQDDIDFYDFANTAGSSEPTA